MPGAIPGRGNWRRFSTRVDTNGPDTSAGGGAHLIGFTPVGRVTVAVLQINDPFRIELSEALMEEGVFPWE